MSYDEDRLGHMYQKAWVNNGHRPVDPTRSPELNAEITHYANTHHTSYDDTYKKAIHPFSNDSDDDN